MIKSFIINKYLSKEFLKVVINMSLAFLFLGFLSSMYLSIKKSIDLKGLMIMDYLSLIILVISFIIATLIASKIYRVGILMYGKKSSYKEIWKWITYKG